jgi:hypothetical protein
MINVIVEVKCNVNNYIQIFYRIGPECRGLAEFVSREHYISVPGEGSNSSFTDVELHTVNSGPTL